MTIYILSSKFIKKQEVRLEFGRYQNGRTALSLHARNGERLMTVSVNLPDIPLMKDCIFVKNYSENEGILQSLIDAKIVEDTGVTVLSGFVRIPVCRLLVEDPREKMFKGLAKQSSKSE